MGTLTEVVLLLWVLVYIPTFESASVFRRMIHDGGEKREQIERVHRVQDIYLNKLENKKPFAVFPFWNKASTTLSPSLITSTTTATDITTNSPFVSSLNVDINFPFSSNNNDKGKKVLPRTRVPSSSTNSNNNKGGIENPQSSSNKASFSNLIKRARQRRRRKPLVRPSPSRIRRTTTLSPHPHPKDGITPTILTQLHTVSEMLVTRNVTSTRTVTDSPLNHTFMLDDFTEFPSSSLPAHPLQVTTTTVSFPSTTITTTQTTTITTTKSPSGLFFHHQHNRHPSAPLLSTGPPPPIFSHEQLRLEKELENEKDQITTTVSPIPEFFSEITTKPPDITTTFYPPVIQEAQQREELRSPKKIRDSPVEIELLNPFEEQHDKEVERIPREEVNKSPTRALEEGKEKKETNDDVNEKLLESEEGVEDYQETGEVSEEGQFRQYHEMSPGQYHEKNPGQYYEVNPGQYHEKNPGQYHEINPGQYVHHSETEEGNPTTIQIHHRDEDKKVYNVQSKVDEFIIGEYGTISKSSGQTLQGVRYTAIGESVDSKLIYDTLIKFFNFE